MDLIHIGGLCGAILSIIALVKAILKFIKAIDDLKNSVDSLKTNVKEMKTDFEQSKKTDKNQSKAILSILRQHIIQMTNQIQNKGYIDNEELYCLNNLYDCYKKLGGNCTVDVRYKEVIKLPVQKSKYIEIIKENRKDEN